MHRLRFVIAAFVMVSLFGCAVDEPREAPLPVCPEGSVYDADAGEASLSSFPDGCVPLACGLGSWGLIDVDRIEHFVAAGAEGAGDGSMDAPFATLEDGLEAAEAAGGGTIGVAAGTYVEEIQIAGSVVIEILGRCEELVTIDGSQGVSTATMTIDLLPDAALRMSGVTITGGAAGWDDWSESAGGLLVRSGNVELTSSRVTGNHKYGVVVEGEGSRLSMEDCRIDNNLTVGPRIVQQWAYYYGRGIGVWDGAQLDLTTCRIEDNTEGGIYAASPGTVVLLDHVVVDGTRQNEEGWFGYGMQVYDGAHTEAVSSVISGGGDAGIVTGWGGAEVVLQDVVVSDHRACQHAENCAGILVQDSARIEARNLTVDGNMSAGVSANTSGTSLEIRDAVIRGTIPAPGDETSVGIAVADGAEAALVGITVEDNVGVGLIAFIEGTTVTLEDSVIRHTLPALSGEYGRALAVTDGATLTASGCSLQDNSEMALFADGAQSIVHLDHCQILDTQRGSVQSTGIGIVSQAGAWVTAIDLLVQGSQGPGIYAVVDGRIDCIGCEIVHNEFAGVAVRTGGQVAIIDTTISSTVADDSEGGGVGVMAADDYGVPVSLILRDSLVEDHDLAAVWLVGGGDHHIVGNVLEGGAGLYSELPDGTTALLGGEGIVATAGDTPWHPSSIIDLADNEITDAARVGVLLDGAAASLAGNSFAGNDTDVWRQQCDEAPQSWGLDDIDGVECPETTLPVVPLAFDLYLSEPVSR